MIRVMIISIMHIALLMIASSITKAHSLITKYWSSVRYQYLIRSVVFKTINQEAYLYLTAAVHLNSIICRDTRSLWKHRDISQIQLMYRLIEGRPNILWLNSQILKDKLEIQCKPSSLSFVNQLSKRIVFNLRADFEEDRLWLAPLSS